ncbi:MAG: asparagine synthase (glutamine-hydrolyzing) [Prolixibacteraceae bacterium]|nr:asparagine synthase (glutamine-hydrolyzing) [Prolixibacteraceae bacterium]
MCGIAGTYNYSLQVSEIEESIKGMLSVIRHRGPDETGIYTGEGLGLGNVRLSIIDLASGQQPMSDASGNYWIVYNGEIFNYIELQAEIEKKGISLKTKSDTEVIVQMYALYGKDCLQYLNGQFAFCIWDKKNKELFIARDRVGIRPLYYWKDNGSFAFCSEIKGLFTLDKIKREICTESLGEIFTFWTTISPNTPFKGIYELPPGHFMIVNSEGLNIEKYWSLNFRNKNKDYEKSFSETVEEYSALLEDAVKIRLRADVPVGAYLSGGLDSSVTTALIKKINPDILNTFSIGFEDQEYDETKYQLEAAEYLNTRHQAFKCSSYDIADAFQKTVWHTEFPILRTAPTPMYLLSKKVRENNLKVVITGEGADEVLAGYNIFKEAKIRRFWANDPESVARPKLLGKLYPYIPMIQNSNNIALKMFFGFKLNETANPFYSHLLRWHNTSRIKNYLSEEVRNSNNGYNPMERLSTMLPCEFNNWSGLAKAQFLETSVFMSGYLLSSQGDRMAMANSVEGRYPFLDYRVIEYCAQLPDNFKLNFLDEKFLLKKVSKGIIPESITNRSKQAYRAPIAGSFFDKNAPGYIEEMLSEKSVNDSLIFDPGRVKNLINKIKSQNNASELENMAVAGILSTQLIYEQFIKNSVKTESGLLKNIKIVKEA